MFVNTNGIRNVMNLSYSNFQMHVHSLHYNHRRKNITHFSYLELQDQRIGPPHQIAGMQNQRSPRSKVLCLAERRVEVMTSWFSQKRGVITQQEVFEHLRFTTDSFLKYHFCVRFNKYQASNLVKVFNGLQEKVSQTVKQHPLGARTSSTNLATRPTPKQPGRAERYCWFQHVRCNWISRWKPKNSCVKKLHLQQPPAPLDIMSYMSIYIYVCVVDICHIFNKV